MDEPLVFSEEQLGRLHGSHVGVVGCGGIGCYVIEFLLRLKVGSITVADGDRFDESNLNRQLYCTRSTIGKSKVLTAKARALDLCPETRFEAVGENLSAANAGEHLRGCDVVIDALDSAEARLMLEEACAGAGIPLIHGAVGGWRTQVSTVLPGKGTMQSIYSGGLFGGAPTLSFVPAYCAAIEVAEVVKILCLGESNLQSAVLLSDLFAGETFKIKLKKKERS